MVSNTASRGIVTIAMGAQPYIEMAKSFGMSIRLNAPDTPSAVLTDSEDPELKEFYTHVIPHSPEMGTRMEPKFYLDRFSPFDENLYIDTDCLVVNDLARFWDYFAGQYFAIPGWRYLSKQDRDAAVDVGFVLDKFGLDRLAKFNGGCYYYRKSSETTAFFNTARQLLADAGSLKIGDYWGGGFSDEPLFSLALGIHGLEMTNTGTSGFWTPIGSRGPIRLDLFKQKCQFRKEGRMVYPDIVHFPAGYRESYVYHREVWRLKRHFGKSRPGVVRRTRTTVTGLAMMSYRDIRHEVKLMLQSAR